MRTRTTPQCGTSHPTVVVLSMARSGPPIDRGHSSGNCHGHIDGSVTTLDGFDLTLLTGKTIVLGANFNATPADALHELVINPLTELITDPLNLSSIAAMHRLEVGAHGSVTGAANFGCIDDHDLGDPRDVGCLHREDPQRLTGITGTAMSFDGDNTAKFDSGLNGTFGGNAMVTVRQRHDTGGGFGHVFPDLRRGLAGLVNGAFVTGSGSSFACAA